MGQINRPLLYVAVAVGCFSLATASLVYANAWWLSAIVTLSIGCWLSGVLWTIYTPPSRRAAPLGAVVCSFLYVLLATGPWFQNQVGPWLLTTRALVAIDTHLLGHEQPAGVSQPQAAPGWIYTTTLNTNFINYTVPQGTALWSIPQQAAGQPPVSATVAIGQWLFAWCAAAIGGLAAGWIARRSSRPVSSASLPATVPFRELAP